MIRGSTFRPYHSVGEEEEKTNSIPTSPMLSISPLTLGVSAYMYPRHSVYNSLCDSKNEKMAELNRKKWQLSEREDRINRDEGHVSMTDEQFQCICKLHRQIGSLVHEIEDLEKILLKYEIAEMTHTSSDSLFAPISPMTQSPFPQSL